MLFMLKYLGGVIEKKYQRWDWFDNMNLCRIKNVMNRFEGQVLKGKILSVEYTEERKSIIKHEHYIRKIDIKIYSGWSIKTLKHVR